MVTLRRRLDNGNRRLLLAIIALLLFAVPIHAQRLDQLDYIIGGGTLDVTFTHFTVGQYLGFYEEEGIDLQFVTSDGAVAAIQALAAGHYEIGSTLRPPILLSHAEGVDLGLVSIYTYVRNHFYLVGVAPDSPIRSIADLQGKVVGAPSMGAAAIPYLQGVLREVGIDPSTVTFLPVGFGVSFAEAMYRGQVDALVAWETIFASLETQGYEFRYLDFPDRYATMSGPQVSVRRDLLERNRDKYVRFLRGLLKSTVFALHNPEAAVRIHWHLYPESRPWGMSEEEALKAAMDIQAARFSRLGILNEPKGTWGMNYPLDWELELEIYGLTDKISDVSIFFTNDLIAEANDFDHERIIQMAREYRFPGQ